MLKLRVTAMTLIFQILTFWMILKFWIFSEKFEKSQKIWIFRKKNWNFFVIFWAQIFNISVLKEEKIFWNFCSPYPGHNFWPWYWKFAMIRTYLESNFRKLRNINDFIWFKKNPTYRHPRKFIVWDLRKFFFSVVCISLNSVC